MEPDGGSAPRLEPQCAYFVSSTWIWPALITLATSVSKQHDAGTVRNTCRQLVAAVGLPKLCQACQACQVGSRHYLALKTLHEYLLTTILALHSNFLRGTGHERAMFAGALYTRSVYGQNS